MNSRTSLVMLPVSPAGLHYAKGPCHLVSALGHIRTHFHVLDQSDSSQIHAPFSPLPANAASLTALAMAQIVEFDGCDRP
jgi:hypothetical protein